MDGPWGALQAYHWAALYPVRWRLKAWMVRPRPSPGQAARIMAVGGKERAMRRDGSGVRSGFMLIFLFLVILHSQSGAFPGMMRAGNGAEFGSGTAL